MGEFVLEIVGDDDIDVNICGFVKNVLIIVDNSVNVVCVGWCEFRVFFYGNW